MAAEDGSHESQTEGIQSVDVMRNTFLKLCVSTKQFYSQGVPDVAHADLLNTLFKRHWDDQPEVFSGAGCLLTN